MTMGIAPMQVRGNLHRRQPCALAALLLAALAMPSVSPALEATGAAPGGGTADEVGKPLPAWRQGELDIHGINTGRGESWLLILPDGTTMLVDMSGKTVEAAPFSLPTRPDASRPPGEWVARYARRAMPMDAGRIDYAMISHFHGDHMGAIVETSPRSTLGNYQLSGITEVGDRVRIGKIIDRGWPTYDFPKPIHTRTVDNYRAFLEWHARHAGLQVERFQPGRNDQITLVHRPGDYPDFEVRNIYANGQVWSGSGNGIRNLFPPASELGPDGYPDENKLSIAFRLRYGKFDYYSGGDLSSFDEETTSNPPAWKDVEPVIARATGPVDVMKANHHGSWDANSIPFLAALQPRVILVGARADGHPASSTWKRMTSQAAWAGERDIFVTNVSEATARTSYNILEQAKGTQGHIVVRVDRGGDSYRVFMLDDGDEQMRVKSVSGPFDSR